MSFDPVRNNPPSIDQPRVTAAPESPRPELVLDVLDVPLATEPLDELPFKEAVEGKLHHIPDFAGETPEQAAQSRPGLEACSQYHGALVKSVKNSLMVAAHYAFATHRPLVLSPDMLWLAIVQGFAEHVNSHAEELRHRFVAHKGKVELLVRRDDFFKGSPENDWPGVIAEFSDKIREHIGHTTHDLLVPRFTTTGMAERAASQIAILDAFQQYFKYTLITICGIPQVVLEGTREDWADLVARAVELGQYGPRGWSRVLELVLGHFVAAFDGKFHQPFWDSLYKYGHESGKDIVAFGWLNVFFPYFGPKKVNPVIGHLANEWHDPNEFPKLSRRAWPDLMDFPPGISRAPFDWHYWHQKFDMQFLAGFVGIRQDTATMRLRPEIGWAIRDVTRQAKGDN